MSVALLPLYLVVKAAEDVNIWWGSGEFPVGADGWKCLDCFDNDEDLPLCRECKINWLKEVGHMNYSDQFERSIGISTGAAFVLSSVCALLLNESAGLWEQGEVLSWITSLCGPLFQLFHYLNPVYNIFLMLTIGLCTVGICVAIGIIMFFLVMNPTGRRHWRHMTPPMYGLLVFEIVYLAFVMILGSTVADLAFVLGPFYIGASCVLAGNFFMRKPKTTRL